jgi:ribosome-associated protein
MLTISDSLLIADEEISWTAIRAQGAGGQNVNKVSSAIHLRFDVGASSLPDWLKDRLLSSADQRVTKEGVMVIKAQAFRSQERNKEAALLRLAEWIRNAASMPLERRPTRPTRAARHRRLADKRAQAERKSGRRDPGQEQ